MDDYDVIVIGTGTAAQVVSSRVRRASPSVAVIDHRPFGGTCALRGCDPKKMLVSGAEAADWANTLKAKKRMHHLCLVCFWRKCDIGPWPSEVRDAPDNGALIVASGKLNSRVRRFLCER